MFWCFDPLSWHVFVAGLDMMSRGHQWICLTVLWIRMFECRKALPGRPWPGFHVLATGRWTHDFIFFVIPGKVITDGGCIFDHVPTTKIPSVIIILRWHWTWSPLMITPGWYMSLSPLLILTGRLFTARQCSEAPVLPPVKLTCPAYTS